MQLSLHEHPNKMSQLSNLAATYAPHRDQGGGLALVRGIGRINPPLEVRCITHFVVLPNIPLGNTAASFSDNRITPISGSTRQWADKPCKLVCRTTLVSQSRNELRSQAGHY